MTKNSDENRRLQELYAVLLKQNIPFVSYRLPYASEMVTLIQSRSCPIKLTDFNRLEQLKGFVVSPFAERNHPTFLLEPDFIITGQQIDNDSVNKLSKNSFFIHSKETKNALQTTTREAFCANVEKIISGIHSGEFQKVVLSKIKIEELPRTFNAGDFFLKLCEKYPSAMVYLFQIPEAGCWAGATPEKLLTIENGTASTVSLAGTQPAAGKSVEKYHWLDKEKEEQQFVTQFIEESLKKSGIQNYTKFPTENVQAAQLIHLQTKFEFPAATLKNTTGNLVRLLHPTPATGGLPKEPAHDFIFQNEGYDRSYYTGFIGPVNIHAQTHLFVNLRCVQLFEKEYVLYSGAGITSSSVPQKEWEETESKMETVRSVIIS